MPTTVLGLALRLFGALAGLSSLDVSPAWALVGPTSDAAGVEPYLVMVLNHVGRLSGYCSGLVVAADVVLTAAHCVPQGAAVKVHFRDPANAPVLLDVAAIERHPDYHPDAIRTRERSIDLALIRLSAPLPDRFKAAPTGAAAAAIVPGTPFRLAGFGLSKEGDPRSSGQLRVAAVVAREPLSKLLLWARGLSGSGGACTGDSGGPVFAQDSDTVVALMVWSAGSGGRQCGALTQAVWLAPEKIWIDSVLARWASTGK